MTVSVVIPFYNQAEYVVETVESVLAQTYQDFEIVIVDDASPERLPRQINRLVNSSKKIRVVRNQVNGGVAAARNVGIANSRGEFILPLDSDDNIVPTYLERIVPEMTDGVGVVGTWLYMEPDWQSQRLGHSWQMLGSPESSYPIFPPTRKQILAGNSIAVCSLVRKEALKDVGGYAEDFPRGFEDWCLWASIVCSGNWKIKIVEEYLFRYRVHCKSICRSGSMISFHEAQALMQERFK
jgi:glycosyltransferase involved in cell wall biosynthesis